MEERWRDVVGYVGYYQVSDQGSVRSLDRVVHNGLGGTKRLKGKVLSLIPGNKYGHLGVKLWEGGVETYVRVHQLVAEVWIGFCPDNKEVCHGPNGTEDNSVSNLSYGTRSENGLDKRRDGTHNGRAVRRSDGVEFISMMVAGEASGCWYQSIWKVCNGKYKTAGGYGWKYV